MSSLDLEEGNCLISICFPIMIPNEESRDTDENKALAAHEVKGDRGARESYSRRIKPRL